MRAAQIGRMAGRDWLLLCTLAVIWGGSFFFNALAVPHLPPVTIVLIRCALGAALLALVLGRGGMPRGRAAWLALGALSLLNTAVPFTLIVLAQMHLPSALAAILNATTPIFTVAVAHLATTDERATPLRVAGVAVGFAGVAVMPGGAATGGGGAVLPYLASLGAAICYAFGSVLARRLRPLALRPDAVGFGQLAAATVILAPVALIAEAPWTLPAPPPAAVAALLALGLLCTGVGYMLYFRVLASAGATNVALVTFLVPVSAILLGVLVLGEQLEARHVAGFALIAGGLALIDGRLVTAARRGSWR